MSWISEIASSSLRIHYHSCQHQSWTSRHYHSHSCWMNHPSLHRQQSRERNTVGSWSIVVANGGRRDVLIVHTTVKEFILRINRERTEYFVLGTLHFIAQFDSLHQRQPPIVALIRMNMSKRSIQQNRSFRRKRPHLRISPCPSTQSYPLYNSSTTAKQQIPYP